MPLIRLSQRDSGSSTIHRVGNKLKDAISDPKTYSSASAWFMIKAKHGLQWVNRPRQHIKHAMTWLQQPHVRKIVLAQMIVLIVFTVVFTLLSAIGFTATGVGGGTLAAAFQSWAYGGFTPAGGLFATLTSMGMLGTLVPVQAGVAAAAAVVVTVILWARGDGH